MKAAIYAKYSSENQSEKSIDDQIRVCKKYCAEHELTVCDKHIYVDEALSGSLLNRPGLQEAITRCSPWYLNSIIYRLKLSLLLTE